MHQPTLSFALLAACFLAPPSMCLLAQNLIRNGSFETFVGNEPSGWTTTNIPKTLLVVSPTSKCHGGTLAARCEVKDFFGSKLAGMLTQKDVPLRGGTLELSGYYVLNAVGKDAGFVSIELQSSDGNIVKIHQKNLTTPTQNFVPFSITFSPPEDAERLELRLTLLPGEGSDKLHEGSYLLLDDVRLVPVTKPSKGKEP